MLRRPSRLPTAKAPVISSTTSAAQRNVGAWTTDRSCRSRYRICGRGLARPSLARKSIQLSDLTRSDRLTASLTQQFCWCIFFCYQTATKHRPFPISELSSYKTEARPVTCRKLSRFMSCSYDGGTKSYRASSSPATTSHHQP